MKWRDFRSELLSGLHCTKQYGSLDHLISRSLNRKCIGSITSTNLNLLLPSLNRTNESETLQHAIEHSRTRTHIQYTRHMHFTHTCTVHTVKHTYIHIHTHIHYVYICTCKHPNTLYIYTCIHSYIHPHTCMHL